MSHRTGRFLFVSLLLIVGSASTYGDPVTINIAGTLSSVDSYLGPTFEIGQSFTIVLTYDSDAPVSSSVPSQETFGGAITSLTLTIYTGSASAYVATLGGSGNISVSRSTNQDNIAFRGGLDGPAVNGFEPYSFELFIRGPGGSLSSGRLPEDLDPFVFDGDHSLGLTFNRVGTMPRASSYDLHLESAPSVVPEPTVLTLLGVGLLGLTLARRMRATLSRSS